MDESKAWAKLYIFMTGLIDPVELYIYHLKFMNKKPG